MRNAEHSFPASMWAIANVDVPAPGFGQGQFVRYGPVTVKPGESRDDVLDRLSNEVRELSAVERRGSRVLDPWS